MTFRPFLIMLPLILIISGATVNSSARNYTRSYIQNQIVEIYEDMTISGELHIINSTLIFHGHRILIAKPGSKLFIENSEITGNGFSIFVEKGAKFRLLNSEVQNFGSIDLEAFRNVTSGERLVEYNRYLWIGPDFTRNVNLYGEDGIVIKADEAEIVGNVFRNYTSIRIYSSNNLIKRNRFIEMRHEGLAFMNGSNGNRIISNYFGQAKRMDREIFGLRFYPGTKNEEVYNNTFEDLPIGIMVANIPPWDAGENFTIHGNRFKNSIFGFTGKLKNSHIFNETYVHNLSPVHFEACVNLVFENSTILDVTYQPKVMSKEYFKEVWERKLLKNMAYWMYGFYCSKAMLSLGWSGYNITIRNNVFSNGPPYTMAVDFDMAKGIKYVYIVNNTFLNIGSYIPRDYIVRNDWTGYNRIANVTPIDGACIALEGSDYVYIVGNKFTNVLNGVATSSPDNLGNFGNLIIRDNVLVGVDRFKWREQRYLRSAKWWTGNYSVEKDSIGIALGMRYVKKWDAFKTYAENSTILIEGNELINFTHPIVIDFKRDQAGANEMGVKRAIIRNNSIENYGNMLILHDPPNSVLLKNNNVIVRGLVNILVPDEVQAGENFEVVALFNNTSSFPLNLDVKFKKDNLVFDVKKTLIPAHSVFFEVKASTSFIEPGNHSISVNAGGREIIRTLRVIPTSPNLGLATTLITLSALLMIFLTIMILAVWKKP